MVLTTHLVPLDPPELLLNAPLLLLHLLLGGLVQRGELPDERLVLRLAHLHVRLHHQRFPHLYHN